MVSEMSQGSWVLKVFRFGMLLAGSAFPLPNSCALLISLESESHVLCISSSLLRENLVPPNQSKLLLASSAMLLFHRCGRGLHS
jgi:hypothetical protein